MQSEDANKRFLEKLSIMEENHKKIFEDMFESFSTGIKEMLVFDPEDSEVLYLQAIAGSHGGEGSSSVAESLSGEETMKEIINIALELENTSILYYIGLKEMVKSTDGKNKIDTIIGEERKHVVQLSKALNEIVN